MWLLGIVIVGPGGDRLAGVGDVSVLRCVLPAMQKRFFDPAEPSYRRNVLR